MKMADILRDIADLLDQKMGQQDDNGMGDNRTQNRLDPVEVPEPELDDNPVMVPPLQAKLEILKKSEGIPNVYADKKSSDELAAIKKNAGLSASQHEASEDNDILG
jgi:hypothetical protein